MAKANFTVNQSLQRLREFYKLGAEGKMQTQPPARERAKDEPPKRLKRRNVDEYRKKHGFAMSYIHLAIRFAELYDKRQFQALCAKIRKAGHPLGVSHIGQLVEVRDDRERENLLEEALANRWSFRQLTRVREEQYGVFQREGRGRKQQDPVSPADAQTQLLMDAKRLARRLDRLRSIQKENKDYRVPTSSPLAKALDKSAKAVGDLIGALALARKRRRTKAALPQGNEGRSARVGK